MVSGALRSAASPRVLLPLLAALAAGTGWQALRPPAPTLTATFLDVGQGDCAVLQTRGGRTIVVDAGRRTDASDAGRSVVLPFLRSQGASRVDALLLTHPDDDHVGGAPTILRKLPVGRVLISGLPSDAPTYNEALAVARERGVPIVTLRAGQTVRVEPEVAMEVVSPPPGPQPPAEHPSNAGSLVVRMRAGATTLLLTGDADADAEAGMLARREPVRSDLLKVGHHGSPSSSTEPFLKAVAPQVAIISVGRRNAYGHPSRAVLDRLARRGARILRTDECGAITAVSDGRTWRLRTYRRPPWKDAPNRGVVPTLSERLY
jgi:competence protein ComEC